MKKFLIVLVFIIGFLNPSFASEDIYVVGVSGYDPVAFFEDMTAKKGHPDYTYKYEDVTYQFTSKEYKEIFKDDPEKYLPQYGGWCAYGIAFEAKIRSDPEFWIILDGKLYINDEHSHGLWLQETTKLKNQADQYWATQVE